MLIRQLLGLAARRAAADPRVRAKTAEFVETTAKPMFARKMQGVRDVATRVDPRENPAYFAGRALRRLLDD